MEFLSPSRQHSHRYRKEQQEDLQKHVSGETDYDNLIRAAMGSYLSLPPLDTKDHRVRRWLAQTEEHKTHENRSDATGRKHEDSHFSTSRRPGALRDSFYDLETPDVNQLPPIDFIHGRNVSSPRALLPFERGRKRRRRNSISDSSWLENVETKHSDNRTQRSPNLDNDKHGLCSQGTRKAVVPIAKPAKHERTQEETFEKRPRHRTRVDLYEPKDQLGDSESHSREKRRNSKRRKEGSRRSTTRKAREELMNSFSSENINQERLTVSISCRNRYTG